MSRPFYYLLPLLLLAGCAVGPNYHPPKPAVPAAFANGGRTSLDTAEAIAAWWREFHDPELNRLVERAMASNLDLRIATANLREARALLLGAKADILPVVTGDASYANNKYSRAGLFGAPQAIRQQELYTASFDAAWELDIFGGGRRNVEAHGAQVEALEATRHDVQVSLTAEVARNYFALRGAQNEWTVQQRNASNQSETLKITQARLEAGGGTELDVAQARAQLNNTLAGLPLLESSIAHATHRLGVLLGLAPAALAEELQSPASLPELPGVVSIGTPADLLRRRPDIRVAERNLAASTALIGVATADLFPKVTFNGSIGLQGNSFSGMGGPASDTRSFGPSITWAALDLGHVRAAVKGAGAQVEGQLAQYEKTVLTSLEETENALVDYGRNQARRDYLQESVKASRRAAELAHDRFTGGLTDFLVVLDAERTELESEDQLAQTQTQTALALIAIYKSLGGGWQ